MKPKSISYSKTIPTGQYQNEKIGIEFDLDDTDNPEEALSRAKALVEKWHRENNPQLYQDTETSGGLPLPADYMQINNIKMVDKSGNEQPITISGVSIESIQSCTDIKTLSLYEMLIDKTKDPELKRNLWLAYDERYAHLQIHTA